MTVKKDEQVKTSKPDYHDAAIEYHRRSRGKLAAAIKVPVERIEDLGLAYTPGVAVPCKEIERDPSQVNHLTIKQNTVAVVTDGSAVLGLGNIGPQAAMPVMEGKALLFKRYADIDAWPICLDTQDSEEIIRTVRNIAPGFGGINLEDISAPRCFEIERALQDLGIPVFHDDQDGTAITTLAALINAAKVVGRDPKTLRIVICGAGAAGIAIARLIMGIRGGGAQYAADLIMCDSKGVISSDRNDLNDSKKDLLRWTNKDDVRGTVYDALKGADVFLGVSQPGLLKAEDIRTMNDNPIVLAMANPIPEIFPDEAKKGGAAVVATGRSDFPNQVNNVLVFPGLFRGLLDAGAKRIAPEVMPAAALALADTVPEPTADRIIPGIWEEDVDVTGTVARAVCQVARDSD